MKKIYLILIALVFIIQTYAQNNKIYCGVAPIGFINKIRISAEKDIKNKISGGGVLSHYYGDYWKGQKIDFNVKYYFTKKNQEFGQDGIYTILQTGISLLKIPYTIYEESSTDYSYHFSMSSPRFIDNKKYLGYGLGIGMGYRKVINRFYIDANFRFQYWGLQSKPTITEDIPNGTKTNEPFSADGLTFRTTGPGAFFAPTFIFGYIF